MNILYNSGDLFLPKRIRNFLSTDILGSSDDTFYISYWSLIHFMSGILAGQAYTAFGANKKNYYATMIFVHTLWELWQIYIGMAKPYKLKGSSNLVDTIVDTILFMSGTYIFKNLIDGL